MIVALTFRGVVVTLVVPRRGRRNGRIGASLLTATLWGLLERGFELVARAGSRRWRGRDLKERYEAEDQLLGRLAPVSLLSLLGAWLLCIFLGFSLMLWGDSHQGLAHALDLSGSSISTLGVRPPVGTGQTVLCYLAAASGLIVLAIEIGYLPTIYGHFNRREAQMRILESRAGRPAWGPEVLVRHHNVAALDTMGDFYAGWEAWSADLMESHLTFPWLMIFRSSDPLESWVTSLLAVLDSAAMYLALCPATAPNSRARQCLRMGFTALRRLAEMLNVKYDADPKPTDRIALTESEFELAVDYLKANGFPLERTAAEAWPDFRGWRVNYEHIAYKLARRFHAPPVLWSGAPQSLNPLIVRDRSHDDPEGTKNRVLPSPPARSAPP